MQNFPFFSTKKINNKYKLLLFIENRFGDPITSLNFNENFLIIGTTLGKLTLYNFHLHKIIILSEYSNEQIEHISFISSYSFQYCLGDEKIVIYDFTPNNKNNFEMKPLIKEIENYNDEYEHLKYCDLKVNFLYKNLLLQVELSNEDKKPLILTYVSSNFLIKNLNSKQIINNGIINLCTYIIPFDFNGKGFIYVEILNQLERNIVYFDFEKSNYFKLLINKNFGHISDIKFLKENKIFLIRDLNFCEIRKINDNFTLIYSFKNLGEKVISSQIFYSNEFQSLINNNNNNNNNNNKFNIENENLNSNQLNKSPTKNKENKETNKPSIASSLNEKAYKENFILLDIEGNINIFSDGSIQTLFNVNNININKQNLQKGLFSLGYKYHIKYYKGLFAITSDFGVYLITSY